MAKKKKRKNPSDATIRNVKALNKKLADIHYELSALKKQLDVQKIILKRRNWVMPVKKK